MCQGDVRLESISGSLSNIGFVKVQVDVVKYSKIHYGRYFYCN